MIIVVVNAFQHARGLDPFSLCDIIRRIMNKKTRTCLTKLGNGIGKIVYDLYDSHDNSIGLLCLHNNMSNKGMFEELVEELSKQINVVVPDMIGRGISSASDEYKMEQYLQDCISIINMTGFKQIILLGNGLGAKIALNLAKLNNFPAVSVIIDQIDYQYENLIYQIDTSSHKNIESIALAVREIVNDPQCTLEDYLDFVVRHVKMVGQRIVPICDLNVASQRTEEINYASLIDAINSPVLMLHEEQLINDKSTVKELMTNDSSANLRIKYSIKERKAISEWIKNFTSIKEKLKNHFAIDTGSSKAKIQA